MKILMRWLVIAISSGSTLFAKTSVVVYSAERVKTNYRHVDFIIKRQPFCYHQLIVGEELMINSGSCSENYIIENT